MKNNLFIILVCFCFLIKAQKTYTNIALFGGVTHIGNGKIIENSLITIRGSKIETVQSATGIKINPSAFDTIIYINGKQVYPAFINVNNVLGLHDAEAVKATRDFNEVGIFNPHIRACIAYNTDNLIIPTVKTNGVLYTQVTPRGGVISGSSSIMALEGWNWEDALLKADDGIHLNFPKMIVQKWAEDDKHFQEANKKYTEELLQLSNFFNDAYAYYNEANPTEKNIRLEAMKSIFAGKANLYVHVDKAKDILNAINFCEKYKCPKLVIVGGKESYKITKVLKEKNIAVMLNRVNDLPDSPDNDVDLINKLAYFLHKDSVLFCFQLEGDMEAMQSRNLPFNAGVAVANGLDKEAAISALSYNTAKIIGVNNLIGTIEEGKLASFFISDGDALDIKTHQVVLAYIAGKPINLINHQFELYQKYKLKYGLK
jgi:imidazolonepropionase-like amidohydrolase